MIYCSLDSLPSLTLASSLRSKHPTEQASYEDDLQGRSDYTAPKHCLLRALKSCKYSRAQ